MKPRHYRAELTEFGWEVWDGEAFFDPPLVFDSASKAQDEADRLNTPVPREFDESAGSVLTGREWD